MKICLDIRVSTKGGTSTFIDNFVRELDDVPHPHDLQFVFNRDTTALNGRQTRAAAVPYNHRVLEFQWSQLQLPRILRKERFDVYHSLKHVGPLRCGTKTIYRVPAVGQFTGNYPLHRLDHVYWNHVAGRAYRNADLLIAVSQYVADTLIQHLQIPSDRVAVVHNGVDSRFRRLPPEDRDPDFLKRLGIQGDYLLCVGNLLPVKNFATAIRAYAMLSESRELPHLVLAGGQRHPHYHELADLVRNEGLESRVRFVGYQAGNDLLQLYNGATLLVHPSLHEGFSFTILEAMACGVPIVAAASTSIPEAAGDAAVYHEDPRNAEELAALVDQLVHDTELHGELSGKGMQRVRDFTWNRCVRRTVATYDRLT